MASPWTSRAVPVTPSRKPWARGEAVSVSHCGSMSQTTTETPVPASARKRVDDGGGEAHDRTADGPPARDEFERQIGADDLQTGAGVQGAQLLGGLAAVGEVAGHAVRTSQPGDRGEIALRVDHAGLHQ